MSVWTFTQCVYHIWSYTLQISQGEFHLKDNIHTYNCYIDTSAKLHNFKAQN
jgi:hypothetical protein